MESKGMDELMQKYYAGETSIEEERRIKEFFKEDSKDNPDKELISYFNNYKTITPEPDDLKFEISEMIHTHTGRSLMRKKVMNSVLYGIAAGIMLIFVIRNLVQDGNVGVDNMTALASINYCEDNEKCQQEIASAFVILDQFKNTNSETIISKDTKASLDLVRNMIISYSDENNTKSIFINRSLLEKALSESTFHNPDIVQYISKADEIFILRIKDNRELVARFISQINQILESNFDSETILQKYSLIKDENQEFSDQDYYVTIQEDRLLFYVVSN